MYCTSVVKKPKSTIDFLQRHRGSLNKTDTKPKPIMVSRTQIRGYYQPSLIPRLYLIQYYMYIVTCTSLHVYGAHPLSSRPLYLSELRIFLRQVVVMAVLIPLPDVTSVLKMDPGFEMQLRFDICTLTSKIIERECSVRKKLKKG